MKNNWFLKPYYLQKDARLNLMISIIVGIAVYLFLYLFEPFNIGAQPTKYFVLGYGVISFFITWGLILLTVKFFDSDKWNIIKQIVLLVLIVTCISFLNWQYNAWYFGIENEHSQLGAVMFYTFSVSIFPISAYLYFDERRLTHLNKKMAIKIGRYFLKHNEKKSSNFTKQKDPKILVKGENQNEELDLNLSNLLCICAEGNYTMVYYKNGQKKVNRVMFRSSLRNMEEQLQQYREYIMRCHKSYVVNLQNIAGVSGNARSLFVDVNGIDFPVPISRNNVDDIRKKLAV